MNHRRRLDQRNYGFLYKLIPGEDCIYCGAVATEIDHVPAISNLHEFAPDYFIERNIDFLKYPSCSECNRNLSDRPLFTLADRCAFLRGKYMAKYKKLLRIPHWTEEELKDLDPYLREYITDEYQLKLVVTRRIKILFRH